MGERVQVQARGRRGATATLDGRRVVITNRRGDRRTLPVEQIGGLVWKRAVPVWGGWLGLTPAGTRPPWALWGYRRKAAAADPWTVTFTRSQQREFEALRAAIEQAQLGT